MIDLTASHLRIGVTKLISRSPYRGGSANKPLIVTT